jgi:hypothetical protein
LANSTQPESFDGFDTLGSQRPGIHQQYSQGLLEEIKDPKRLLIGLSQNI